MSGQWWSTVIDCEDPEALATFYAELLGLERLSTEEDWINIGHGQDRPKLSFQKVERLVPPRWPSADQPQQMHLDILADDMQADGQRAVQLGATLVDDSDDGFHVYTDPAGHPFCFLRSPD